MKKLIYMVIVCLAVWGNSYGQFIANNGITISNSILISTNGDWQNAGSFTNNGTIITSEAWQNSGTLNTNSTGGFILQYAISKSFSPGSNSTKVGFLQKEGIGDASISGKILVKDSLKIISGLIKMNSSADTLGISPSTLTSVATSSYVDGPMACFGAGTFSFPVGRLSQYLPIKFYNSNSSRVGLELSDAPVGYVAGDAVESLTGFPFAWNAVSSNINDIASYIEVKVPDGLVSGVSNPIIVRKVNTNEFEGMGSRLVSSDGLNTTIRSYSSGLKGLFSVANGYDGSMLGDSTELVALYNTTSGNNWTTKTNWRTGTVPTWFGVTEKGGRVTAIVLPNNNIVGGVPSTITNMAALKTLDLSSNKVTSFPDVTAIPAMSTLDISSNNLDFASLEANASLTGSVVYVNQAPVTAPTYNEIPVHSDTLMTIPVGGSTNQYQWKFKGRKDASYSNIGGANSDSYTLTSIDRSKMGDYVLEITNPQVPGLVLTSGVHSLAATANISGTLYADASTAAQAGKMRLLRISSGGYDTIQVNNVSAVAPIGKYLFNSVVLDDYLINGFPDTVLYAKRIPTWYTRTIFWEEADTLVLEDHVSGLDIISEIRPDPPTAGQGEITGSFFETVSGGRILAKSRVSGAAVSVRRVERSGRGKAVILTLVDYRFTDADGQFTFAKLDEAEYRINFQYPGYPMDTTSYITIPIVNNLFERQVGVEAEVLDGKIKVHKLVITGWEQQDHSMDVYPNPTADFIYVTRKNADVHQSQFKLFDDLGRSIQTKAKWDSIENKWELDVRELNQGVYFLQILNQGKVEKLRIIIQ